MLYQCIVRIQPVAPWFLQSFWLTTHNHAAAWLPKSCNQCIQLGAVAGMVQEKGSRSRSSWTVLHAQCMCTYVLSSWKKKMSSVMCLIASNIRFTRYNQLSNRLYSWSDNRLYRVNKHPTGCQTRFDNRFDNRVERTATVHSTGCHTRFDNRVERTVFNRLSSRVVQPVRQQVVYTIQPVVKLLVRWVWQPVECLYTQYNRLSTVWQPVVSCIQPVWQQVVSCKRGLTFVEIVRHPINAVPWLSLQAWLRTTPIFYATTDTVTDLVNREHVDNRH